MRPPIIPCGAVKDAQPPRKHSPGKNNSTASLRLPGGDQLRRPVSLGPVPALEPHMPWLLILSITIQVLLIIHCIKTGRNQIWIWVLELLSIPGAIAYQAVKIIPALYCSRRAKPDLDMGPCTALDSRCDCLRGGGDHSGSVSQPHGATHGTRGQESARSA